MDRWPFLAGSAVNRRIRSLVRAGARLALMTPRAAATAVGCCRPPPPDETTPVGDRPSARNQGDPTIAVSVDGGRATVLALYGYNAAVPSSVSVLAYLWAGTNFVTFRGTSGAAPDLDRIVLGWAAGQVGGRAGE